MRFLLACCSVMLLCGQEPTGDDPARQIAAADQASIELARKWVKDPRPVYKAWAAELYRRNNLYYFCGELVKALGDVKEASVKYPPGSEQDIMRLDILDALIQLNIPLPADIGHALLSAYPNQVTILLSGMGRWPELRAVAQILDNCPTNECWLVMAQGLAGRRGGATQLLQRLKIMAQIKVFDKNRGEGLPFGSAGGVIGGLLSSRAVLAGFPAPHTYHLIAGYDAPIGYTLLLKGRYPAYYRRMDGDTSPVISHRDRNADILEIIAGKIGERPEALGIVAHPAAQFQWTTEERYKSDLEEFIAARRREFAALVALLLRRRALTPEESESCHLNMDVEVIDRRTDQSHAIPVTGLGEHSQ